MKKILLVFSIALVVVGCNLTHVDQDSATLKTIKIKVRAKEWLYTQQGNDDQYNNNYFYAVVNMPEITENVFDYGEVKAYAVFNRNSPTYARKHLLPYVLHVEEPTNTGDWLYFTETYDFIYGIGWAEFNFRTSDFAYEDNVNINPPAMEFDVVIIVPQD
ncbi:MAG: hypothetical protein IKT71_07710 [Paludibacteraceae bacterium]|jgi:hypothetical protein|nr:hypothetical protein [Paludibacteraceae bacterium]